MPSTGKPTPYCGLNQWQGSDKPARIDFNQDNEKTDSALASLSTQLSKKANWYSQGKLTVTQLNDPTYPDCYETSVTPSEASSIGLPAQHWNIKYFRLGKTGGYGTQIALPVGYRGNGVLRLRISEEAEFKAWSDPVATTTPPQEFALPLVSGYVVTPGYKCCYSKAQNGLVLVHLAVQMQSGNPVVAGTHLFTKLPVGFLPAAAVGHVNDQISIAVNPNGDIGGPVFKDISNLIVSIPFYAAS